MRGIRWWLYRALRRALLPGLLPRDYTDMDELIAARLRAAGGSRWRTAGVWAHEMTDIARSAWAGRRRAGLRIPVSMLDVKIGLRMLVRQPGLTAVSLFALAVGIPVGLLPWHAATTFQAPPPVEDAEQLQVLKNYNVSNSRWESSRMYDFASWRDTTSSYAAVAAVTRDSFSVISEDDRSAPVAGAEVTASFFEILRVPPLLGRTLGPADDTPGSSDVVVISYDLWQTRLGGDPGVLGQSIRIGGVPQTVVGVMPEDFLFLRRDHLWLPLRAASVAVEPEQGKPVIVFARLASGVSADAAQAELTTLGERTAAEFPDTHGRLRPEVVPFTIGLFPLPKGGLQADISFYVLQSTALAILVIVCTNIGMLVLARTATRSEEIAVRTALGASRGRVIMQLFTESLVLSTIAAGVGLTIGDYIARSYFTEILNVIPNWIDFGVTPSTALRAFLLAGLSAAVVGVVPALKVTGRDVQNNLQRATAGRSGVRFGGFSSALVVADVALSIATVALIVGVWDTEPRGGFGVETETFLSAELRVPRTDLAAAEVFDQEEFMLRVGEAQQGLRRRLESEPGVGSLAIASRLPGMDHPTNRVEIEGEPLPDDFVGYRVYVAQVDRGYFSALEQPILSGRDFDSADPGAENPTAIVNTSFVERVLEGRAAIGKRMRYLSRSTTEPGPWYEIVGVVGHLGMRVDNPSEDAGVYHPAAPGQLNPAFVAVQVDGDPEDFVPRLREIVGEVDATAIVAAPQPLDEVFSFDSRISGWISLGVLVFIGTVLTLSTMGMYALMSFTVAQRTREIGIRIALGAEGRSVAFTIARRALLQLVVGVVLGMPLAGWLLVQSEASSSRLAFAFATDIAVLLLIGMIACLIPTLRALRIVPTEALRSS